MGQLDSGLAFVVWKGGMMAVDEHAENAVRHPLSAAISYFDKGHASVKGFLTAGSAYALLTILEAQMRDGIGGPLAEIGTYHGKSLIGFGLAAAPGEHVVGIDLFRERGGDFEAVLRDHWRSFGLAEDRLRLHRGASTALDTSGWAQLVCTPARLVHVDGEHTRTAARHDLGLAASLLAADGVIVVDDVLHAWYPEITLAVAEFLIENPLFKAFAILDRQGPLIGGGAKMMIARANATARYEEALRVSMAPNIVCRTAFSGSMPTVFGFDQGAKKSLLTLT